MWAREPAHKPVSSAHAHFKAEERLEGEGSLKNLQTAHESRLDVNTCQGVQH